jgi:hypothetical protein
MTFVPNKLAGWFNMVAAMPPLFSRLVLAACFTLAVQANASAVDLSGQWSGTWQSGSTRHQGPLEAQFVRIDANRYEVFFSGRFFRFIPFRYSTIMAASENDGIVTLSGSKYLGRLVGTFSFMATATDCRFDARYSSCQDHGYFRLTRCSYAPTCAPAGVVYR